MNDVFFTEQLLDLLQKQSYYAGKLSTISEIDDKISKVYLPEESEILNKTQYYYSNEGEPLIQLYKKQKFFFSDAKKLKIAQEFAREVIRNNSCFFGRPTNEQIKNFGITTGGIVGNFHEIVISTIAFEEEMKYEDVMGMLEICKRLGLIAQLSELSQVEGVDASMVENMMCQECVEVLQRLEYSDDYDLARDVYLYSNFNLEDCDDIVEAALVLGENFDQGINEIMKNKVKIKK